MPKGDNINALKADIKKVAEKIIKLKSKRSEVNADIKAHREGLESKGISKQSFDAALRYYEKDPEQREGFDLGYNIAREALGVPMQEGLFDGASPKK